MKIVFFANTSWYLYNFRLSLAKALKADGHDVILVAPEDVYSDKLRLAGFEFVPFNFSRGGINIFIEFFVLVRLILLYFKIKPNLVHHFTIKSVLYGTIAAKLTGVKNIVNSVTGLGYLFSSQDFKIRILRFLLKIIYSHLFASTSIIFQNVHDMSIFLKNNWVTQEQVTPVLGSGVDVDYFVPAAKPVVGLPIIILPARMLWSKGIAEFVQAASMLKSRGVTARFALVGEPYEGNPDSVPVEVLQNWHENKLVEWWGWRDDMLAVYQQASIVCLPSNYREGLSKTLIEAAACGKPLITTDVPGCREVVPHGKNGRVIRHSAPQELAEVILELLESPELMKSMGRESRRLAVELFSTEINIRQTFKVYRFVG